MALIFQEVFTVIARLRVNRQRFSDPDVFRNHIQNALSAAETEGIQRGYDPQDMRAGAFALGALLDETILNSHNPIFSGWQRKPVPEDLFFTNLKQLLGRADSEALADLLEVHEICLLLGFRGRYSGDMDGLISQIDEKIRRIRGPMTPLAWQPPPEVIQPAGDKWTPRLKWAAIASVTLALLLFVFYKVSLSSLVSEVGR